VESWARAEFAKLSPAICTHLPLAIPAIVYMAFGSTVSAWKDVSKLSPDRPAEQPRKASAIPTT
jgi:hypothetical protein